MPDGVHLLSDARFDRLQAGDFRAFAAMAKGALREALERVSDLAPDSIGDAWAYRRAGVIRGIGALSPRSPWTWMLWSFPGELSFADWKRVMRFTRARIARCFDDPACWRVEASASVDAPGASLLLERLGFSLEGVMRCYGPQGEAHRLYAIVRSDLAGGGDVGY